MNIYNVKIGRFFGGYTDFTIEACTKAEALNKAKEQANRGSGNYNINDIKVTKKKGNIKL